jgi:beta-mannosidase
MRTIYSLDEGWTFHRTDDPSTPLPVAQFPTNIHLDLIHHGIIPDPYLQKNELCVQWVGEKDWTYRKHFVGPSLTDADDRVELRFEGLDTFVTITLNGKHLLRSENMFVPARVDVTELLQPLNELVLSFESAWRRGKSFQEQHPEHRWLCWNGDPSRLAVRKAQYHYVRPCISNACFTRLIN